MDISVKMVYKNRSAKNESIRLTRTDEHRTTTTERQNDGKSCISLAVVQDNELD